jgi:hypothetical protein
MKIVNITDYQAPPPDEPLGAGLLFDLDIVEIARRLYRDEGPERARSVSVVLQSIAAGWIEP